jgi:hypothetical protein
MEFMAQQVPRDPNAPGRERNLIPDYSRQGSNLFSLLIVVIIIAAAFALFDMYAGSTPTRTIAQPQAGPGQATPTNSP